MDNKGKNTNIACFRLEMKVLVFADSKFLGNITPANSEGNLYTEQILSSQIVIKGHRKITK
jgi:hypothetical protein